MQKHLLTIDYEDWMTTSYYAPYIHKSQKADYLIEEATFKLLDVLSKNNAKATFFVLGSLAKDKPNWVKEISKSGHEIASHGYSHKSLNLLSKEAFEEEIITTNKILEDIIGKKIIGFRAPFFSLNEKTSWAIEVLESNKFKYDSSIFPMKTPRYGVKNAPTEKYKIASTNIFENSKSSEIWEIPLSVFKNNLISLPIAGGIYGRFLPFFLWQHLLKEKAKNSNLNLYFHPWELHDVKPPNIKLPIIKSFLAHYNNSSYLKKIDILTQQFHFTSIADFLNIESL